MLVDEMSMLTCAMLRDIDRRLRKVFERPSEPFGGLGVILMGDFVQMPPVGGGDLYVKCTKSSAAASLQAIEGYNLFRKFTIVELTTQHRATDALHMRGIASFREWTLDGLRAREDFLSSLQFLRREDLERDPLWATALIVSTDRKCVHLVNDFMVRRYAVAHHKPLIRWRLPLPSEFASRLPPDTEEKLYASVRDLWAYAVEGSPITLTHNIRPERGLSNGTEGTLHSLVLNEMEPLQTAHAIAMPHQGML
jgi:hypothetical protein